MFRFQIYRDTTGGFRWSLVTGGGQAVAHSADRYSTLDSCRRSLQLVRSQAYCAETDDSSAGAPCATPLLAR